MRVTDFVVPEDRERVPVEAGKVLAGRTSFCEWRFRRKDGSTFPGEVSARLLPDGRMLGILRDLSERRKLEQQFIQAQKLEGIGRLAGGVAHDFNNLLTVIDGYAQMTLEDLAPEHPARESLQEITKATSRATGLTRQLLAFSRNQVIEPKNILLNELVLNFEKMLRRIIGEDIELNLVLGSEVGAFRADPSQIEQVILNLAVNARDAMPGGGKLSIETGKLILDEPFSPASPAMAPGPYVTLIVRDSGSGLSQEAKSHLFEPFFTTKEPGKGTGLGLSTVYGIVRQSGGSIWVHSEPGLGTAFRMLFPASEEGAEPAQATATASNHSGTETILLVEDEPGVRRYLRHMLERHGYTVLEAANGREALELVQKNQGTVQLLLTDLVMPELGGAELAARFGGNARATPVLCMSGYTDRLWRPDDPGVGFLQKPFTLDALLSHIRQMLAPRDRAAGAGES